MTTTLIVLAHPEPRSFNAAWAEATRAACAAAGDRVLRSDLVQMGFDPVEAARHYRDTGDAFDPLKAQETAAAAGTIPADVAAELEKLRAADRVIFHFPVWWFGPPAILKGWFDRVLMHGATHSVDERFDTGRFRGRRALFCVTTGSRATESGFDGREGDISMLLWPLAYALRYLGFTVLEPELVHGVHGYHREARKAELEARLRTVLDGQARVIAGLPARAAIPFNADSDFDGAGRLLPDRPSYSGFIRHEG
ncbi:NAD(P)H-dependent oxidoreductase [Ovoidimarina sediminis]|uniref:NAD(P)H-dependent oxidoreductase n=1 Tax=Ovoidimarina sediminis TaxID=3079856 RepID=UPI0029135648|nr:NAD(P)H-dependent oxidoreductase [Rhodophyticola sp. MJ-SS7]MDU8942312.1 NAD(P)H-dependent oxidoreductase [Rhodophyticola sp. MJ-SS7]